MHNKKFPLLPAILFAALTTAFCLSTANSAEKDSCEKQYQESHSKCMAAWSECNKNCCEFDGKTGKCASDGHEYQDFGECWSGKCANISSICDTCPAEKP